jgi:hypothetical protein
MQRIKNLYRNLTPAQALAVAVLAWAITSGGLLLLAHLWR